MYSIRNYYPVSDTLASSGQPFPEQFAEIAREGFDVVINLSMPDSDNALTNERSIVESHGMVYRHIPVPWQSPQLQHYAVFAETMDAFKDKKIWVHCAMNMRASCFIYLYRRKHLGLAKELALNPLKKIWQPEGDWRKLVEQVLDVGIHAA